MNPPLSFFSCLLWFLSAMFNRTLTASSHCSSTISLQEGTDVSIKNTEIMNLSFFSFFLFFFREPSCHSGFRGPQCDIKEYNVLYVVPGSGKLHYVLIASIIGALQVVIICVVVLCITRWVIHSTRMNEKCIQVHTHRYLWARIRHCFYRYVVFKVETQMRAPQLVRL